MTTPIADPPADSGAGGPVSPPGLPAGGPVSPPGLPAGGPESPGAPGRPRAFLTVREAAALLEVSEDTVERACKTGELPATRLGRQWRIYAAPVHARRDGGLDWLLRQHG